jgi:uncharacterized membrane protein
MNDISLEKALSFGWDTMKKNFVLFLGVLVVTFVILGIISFVQSHTHSHGMRLIIYLINVVVSCYLGIGLIRIALQFIDQQTPGFGVLFSGGSQLWSYLLAAIITGVVVGVGCILLVIPGIYLAMRLQFYGYYIVDQGMESIPALKASWAATEGLVLRLFGYNIVLALIAIVGFIALFVGSFAALPTVMCAHAALYRQLVSRSQDSGSAIITP